MSKLFAFEHCGRNVFLLGCSYECPDLKLYGYATERAIKAAITRKFKNGACAKVSAQRATEYRRFHPEDEDLHNAEQQFHNGGAGAFISR